jgi:hypothetical protein
MRRGGIFFPFFLIACGQHGLTNSSFSVYTNPNYQKKVASLRKYDLSVTNDITSHLIKEEWVGVHLDGKLLDQKNKTTLHFYNPRYNEEIEDYRLQFDLLTPANGVVSGEVGPYRQEDGTFQGAIQGGEYYPVPGCPILLEARGYNQFLPIGCYTTRPNPLVGLRVLIRPKRVGDRPILEFSFADNIEEEFEPPIYFAAGSTLK